MLGGGGRRGMGGGGGGSGMIKSFQRAVRAGAGGAPPNTNTNTNIGGAKAGKVKKFNKKQRPTSPNTTLTLSSYSSAPPLPISAPSWVSSSSTVGSDESEWEYVDGIEDETAARGLYEDYVFGTVPSSDEVQHAVSALQLALGFSSSSVCSPNAEGAEVTCKDSSDEVAYPAYPIRVDEKIVSLAGSEMDWVEPSQSLYRSDMVYDAFHLLETEPSVQRMVVSLSSDKAVWDAVFNNEVVMELRGSIRRVASMVGESSNKASGGSNGDENLLNWIVRFAKGNIMLLLEKIKEFVNNAFHAPKEEKEGDGFDEMVKSSFFLSIVVVVIVVLTRTKTKNG